MVENAALIRRPVTIKSFLVPLLTRPAVAKFIKYAVYLFLVVNFGVYTVQDYFAYKAALSSNAPWSEILEQFATTIDTAAWLGLVFLFELETHALSDEAFKGWIPKILRVGRLICYVSISYAAYGYIAESLDNYNVKLLADVSSACQLADQGTSLQLNSIIYEEITAANCSSLSDDNVFYQVTGEVSVVDRDTLEMNRWMDWINVNNALVWLIVVFLIEVEVYLQAADRFSSRALAVARQIKTFFYLVLIANAVIWSFTGYALYTWDAFLWIFGFWAIELNLAEWEQDRLQELAVARDTGR